MHALSTHSLTLILSHTLSHTFIHTHSHTHLHTHIQVEMHRIPTCHLKGAAVVHMGPVPRENSPSVVAGWTSDESLVTDHSLFQHFFHIEFNANITAHAVDKAVADAMYVDGLEMKLSFGDEVTSLTARVGTSFISAEQVTCLVWRLG